MRIYCDTNIYSRPFDDESQLRVRLEIIACLQIFTLAFHKKAVILSSDILVYEIEHSSLERRLSVKPLLALCASHVMLHEEMQAKAERLSNTLKISPRDALHLTSAITASAKFFITCDDEIIQKAGSALAKTVIITNPVTFITSYENTHTATF